MALFGLTAAIYSEVDTLWFKNDTYHFLLFIASLFLVVVSPPDYQDEIVEEGTTSTTSITTGINKSVERDDKSESFPLLQNNKVKEEIDIGGWDLLYDRDANVLAISIFFLAGTGLMYINNVGTIIKSLFLISTHPHTLSSDEEIQKMQNLHVFTLSVFSCLGRISIGFMSDLAKLFFNLPRLWFFVLSGVWLFFAQLLLIFYATDNLEKLLIVTILVGFGFGNIYGIGPTIVSEMFGIKRFGLN